jgi:predicted small metal-binding protein
MRLRGNRTHNRATHAHAAHAKAAHGMSEIPKELMGKITAAIKDI